MFLHAFQAEITHPVTLEKLRLEAPLAEDLAEFMSGLDDADKPLRP
jgi:23S rRNA pseudouridine955/2504/2580 synthase